MASRITRIWVLWLSAMAVFFGVTWALAMFPLPGGSAPVLEDIADFFADIGIIATLKILAVLLLPPIVLTYIEVMRTRRNRGL
jgi:hypothetical protein